MESSKPITDLKTDPKNKIIDLIMKNDVDGVKDMIEHVKGIKKYLTNYEDIVIIAGNISWKMFDCVFCEIDLKKIKFSKNPNYGSLIHMFKWLCDDVAGDESTHGYKLIKKFGSQITENFVNYMITKNQRDALEEFSKFHTYEPKDVVLACKCGHLYLLEYFVEKLELYVDTHKYADIMTEQEYNILTYFTSY